eukprot:6135843-Pleurochrysis_carterae.AAC.2
MFYPKKCNSNWKALVRSSQQRVQFITRAALTRSATIDRRNAHRRARHKKSRRRRTRYALGADTIERGRKVATQKRRLLDSLGCSVEEQNAHQRASNKDSSNGTRTKHSVRHHLRKTER